MFPSLLVGLANQPVIPPEHLRAALDRRAVALREKIATVRAARDAQPEMPGFVRAIFDYTLGQLATEQQWLATYRAEPAELGDQSPSNPHQEGRRP